MKRRERMLDLRSGGWLVLLAIALVAVLTVWMVLPILRTSSRAVGDGRDPATYGFDLESFRLPSGQLVAAGFPRDGVPSLDLPAVMPGSAVAAFNEEHRGKYLVSDDRVIGVEIDGEARAYPLRVLNWHEVVNDTLAGIPIAVTYHPLCDSVVVFDRRVGGEVLELGVSGLLWNSNLLMFDRRPAGQDESLWSQLLARAVAGPAADRPDRLSVLRSSVAHWGAWLRRHPDSSVIEPAEERLERYRRNPYGNYRMTARLRFPVEPMPPSGALPPMAPLVVLETDGETSVFPVEDCVAATAATGVCDESGWLQVERGESSFSVMLEGPPEVGAYHALNFAWWAHHPGERGQAAE